MEPTVSATELTPVHAEPNGSGGTDVWLRRNIATTEEEGADGTTQTMWVADETHGTVAGTPSTAEIEGDFDAWWEAFERAQMSDRMLIEEACALAERAKAQADFTALMTDTEV